VETSGSAGAFSLRFTRHPGETLALDYLRRTGRKRAVPFTAVQEVLRHAGYLTTETAALVDLLTERGLVVAVDGGLRPIVAERTEREQALEEVGDLSARLTALGAKELPPAPEDQSLRDLWAHLDRMRQLLHNTLASLKEQVEKQAARLRDLLGIVRAESIPGEWVKSDVATHLHGIGKLLERTRNELAQRLEKEAGRIDELARPGTEGESWALGWRKQAPSFERIWRELEQSVEDFRVRSGALRTWRPLNERLASLVAISDKVAASDPAISRTVHEFTADLRERFATEHWGPVLDHATVASKLGELEAQSQGLLFSRVQAYVRELEDLRGRFNDFLSGPAPVITGMGETHSNENAGAGFAALYAWAMCGFTAAAERLRTRRRRGQAWRHPTRKSRNWSDVEGQLERAMKAAATPDFAHLTRVGNLLLILRQGFLIGAAERGEVVYEDEVSAPDLPALSPLLAEGVVRIRVEWIERRGEERPES
jgi:hypothetical protein